MNPPYGLDYCHFVMESTYTFIGWERMTIISSEKASQPTGTLASRGKAAVVSCFMQLGVMVILILGVSWINNHSVSLLYRFTIHSWGRWLFFAIGTLVHELSHAVVALLFGFRITEFVPFIADPSSPILGYVSYLYSPGNPVQQAGHFFVGIAPIILPLALLFLLYRFLLPHGLIQEGKVNWRRIFSLSSLLRTMLFLFVTSNIVMHMRCSPQDLQNAIYGLPPLVIALFFLGVASPKGMRYLLSSSIMLSLMVIAFSLVNHVLLRGITLIL